MLLQGETQEFKEKKKKKKTYKLAKIVFFLKKTI